ncbi:MAG: hypothetical protein IPG47_11715 [Thermoflexaceae bacterium]|jgi:hypothetical protein|nr:hypothetical protein [Thermoflexaceae bacterium]
MRKRALTLALLVPAVATLAAAAANGHDASATSQLSLGWNNVAYMGDTRAPSEALSGIAGKYAAVYRWNTTTQAYDMYAPGAPAYANSLSSVATGDALWINVTGTGGSLPSVTTGGGTGTPGGPGKVAVPASAFLPASDLALYEKTFNELRPASTDDASKRYYAPINLPDGATITSMTAHYEATGGDVQVRLDYTPLGNGSTTANIFKLVEVLSSSGASPQTSTAFAHTVDNGANVYFLVVDLTGGAGTKLRGVSVAFTR